MQVVADVVADVAKGVADVVVLLCVLCVLCCAGTASGLVNHWMLLVWSGLVAVMGMLPSICCCCKCMSNHDMASPD